MTTLNSFETTIGSFVARWQASGAAERANYQLFLSELCEVLDLPRPEPTKPKIEDNAYVFERDVTFQNLDGTTSIGRIDLYKRGCFVLEAKQGSQQPVEEEFELAAKPAKLKKGTAVRGTKGWDDAMLKARGQAEQYARALPTDEGWPPFLIVVDVGHTIELFADFTRAGKTYLPFPDPATFRIKLPQLAEPEQQAKLKAVWTDPLSLDPSRRSAKVTRELADRLAELAKSLEASKYTAARVAQFLMRCLFTMFAEDVELLPRDSFKTLLERLRSKPHNFPDMVSALWQTMDTGGFSTVLEEKVRWFNGGLFEECEALPLTGPQLELLVEASKSNWREVEPAIFGTLLERALDPVERHKLGAHYTPRAYVERLVMPTIVEPLREEWDSVRAAAVTLAKRGETAEAIKTVRDFHIQLCETNILDPACGSGNFLYVALEHLKRLEGEVLNTLRDFGFQQMELRTVNPEHFHGIEVNPRAAAIADLVLWIGYLQWHLRTRDLSQLVEPIIRKFRNIECRDAVLAWDSVEEVRDEQGQPVTRWDGRTTKTHPVTGELVPDDTARAPVLKYINPRKAEWPHADYIVSNPPFVGNKRMKLALGDGYVATLRETQSDVPGSADLVMYWWDVAAMLLKQGQLKRFGLITTNSITQAFNRQVIERRTSGDDPISIGFAIPDHPWVDTAEGAAVRVAMTVGFAGAKDGELQTVVAERESDDGTCDVSLDRQFGRIHPDLSIGAARSATSALRANAGLAFTGMYPLGQGFVVENSDEQRARGSDGKWENVLKPYRTARDLTQLSREAKIIDFYPRSVEDCRSDFPNLYQWVLDRVKPERDQNPVPERRRNWWLFTRPIPAFRAAVVHLQRFIAIPRTAKFFTFQFVDVRTIVDTTIVAIVADDACVLGTLSSKPHRLWALNTGGTLEDRPRYQHQSTFDPFPFPTATDAQQQQIRELGEQLDAHRKRQQAAHPGLTMTGMYNVLEKLRSGEPLNDKEQTIHEQGLVSVLKQLHDELDAAVFDAYGWPVTLTEEEILERLVALNAERAAEEQRGLIRWLRPEFQNPATDKPTQKTIALPEPDEDEEEPSTTRQRVAKGKSVTKAGKQTPLAGASGLSSKKAAWPKSLPDQVQAIRQHLATAEKPLTAADVTKLFSRANAERIEEVLDTLVLTGTARRLRGGKFVAS